jgi:import inner membrane translocase subunit TIM21
MKISSNLIAARSGAVFNKPSTTTRLLLLQRNYATQNSIGASPQTTRRRKVTAFNDDGRIAWADLSVGEKASRASQQTFNLGMIIVGLVLTVRMT